MRLRRIVSLVFYDFKVRFAGSLFGPLWALFVPLASIFIYWFVYTIALQGAPVDDVPYLPWLLAGVLPWFFFAEAMQGTTSCFWDYRFLIRKVQFHAEELPLVRVCGAALVHFSLLCLVYPVLCATGVSPNGGQVLLFFWLAGGFFLHLGLGRILALCCVRMRDLAPALSVLLQWGFWVTPVFWNVAALPENLQVFWDWNPIAILVEGYRQALLFGQMPDREKVGFFCLAAAVLYGIGALLMKKEAPTLADRL